VNADRPRHGICHGVPTGLLSLGWHFPPGHATSQWHTRKRKGGPWSRRIRNKSFLRYLRKVCRCEFEWRNRPTENSCHARAPF
jgi:hypothetical protein